MIKISKINGLQLQEPPITNIHYQPASSIKPKENEYTQYKQRDDDTVKKSTPFPRQTENNTFEYNNINTSFSENKNNIVINKNDVPINRSYNFKNMNENTSNVLRFEEIVKRNSMDMERIEKNLEVTNDKLKSNNNAKANIMNKMEFSFRDVSKFLKQ